MKKILLLCVVILTACAPVLFTPTTTAQPTETAPAASPAPAGAIPSQTASPAPMYCTVATGAGSQGALNLRTGPGTQYAVIRVLTEAEKLQVITRGAWLEVATDRGERGYINSSYCTIGE